MEKLNTELHASNIESDVLRAEAKMAREMFKQVSCAKPWVLPGRRLVVCRLLSDPLSWQLREERDASIQAHDEARHELQACKADLAQSKFEGKSSDHPDGDMAADDDTKSQSIALAEACTECKVHEYKYRSLRQEFSDREAQLQEQISLLTKTLQVATIFWLYWSCRHIFVLYVRPGKTDFH